MNSDFKTCCVSDAINFNTNVLTLRKRKRSLTLLYLELSFWGTRDLSLGLIKQAEGIVLFLCFWVSISGSISFSGELWGGAQGPFHHRTLWGGGAGRQSAKPQGTGNLLLQCGFPQWFSLAANFVCRHFWSSWQEWGSVLLESSGRRPGMWLNILQCTGQLTRKRS